MSKVYCALFMGQGGIFTSWGMSWMASDLRKLGAEADVYSYNDWQRAETVLDAKRNEGYRLALIGYSLGDSAATYLQTLSPFDLVVCIAESELAQNYRIDKRHTKRSVLLYGWGTLSGGGLDSGFDQAIGVYLPHLLMDLSPTVFSTVKQEVNKLL
jgi:hypothetical protein